MEEKSKILFIGGTGYIGKFIVEASIKDGYPTFLLVRESSVSDPSKGQLIENFKQSGATLLYGDLYDHESLVKAIKQVDVVISTVGHGQSADQVKIIAAIKEAGNVKKWILGEFQFSRESRFSYPNVDVVISTVGHGQSADQVKIIAAIKEAGNVKRFFPSEFGNEVDRTHVVEPAKSAFATKAQIRRAVEAEEIPHTFVSSNFFGGYLLPNLVQPGAMSPPRDKVVILGDGTTKVVFNGEDDIGTYTIKAVDDPRTLNKVLYIKPPNNTLSFNELAALWEKKIGKTPEKIYVPEEEVLKQIQEAPIPLKVILSINHSVFVKGDHTNFDIEPSFGVEAFELYPEVKYTTVDEYLNQFV